MKVGMICECTKNGPDVKIGEHFVKLLVPGADFKGITMDNKANLIRECGREAKLLLETDKCDVVFIVWDLAPAWPDMNEKRCRFNDKEGIRTSFQAAYGTKIPYDKIVLICVEQMLDAWVLCDSEAVFNYASRPTHAPRRFKEIRRPDEDKDPKSRLMNYFRNAGSIYNDYVDALPIIKSARLSKLESSRSFQRFADKLRQLVPVVAPRRR